MYTSLVLRIHRRFYSKLYKILRTWWSLFSPSVFFNWPWEQEQEKGGRKKVDRGKRTHACLCFPGISSSLSHKSLPTTQLPSISPAPSPSSTSPPSRQTRSGSRNGGNLRVPSQATDHVSYNEETGNDRVLTSCDWSNSATMVETGNRIIFCNVRFWLRRLICARRAPCPTSSPWKGGTWMLQVSSFYMHECCLHHHSVSVLQKCGKLVGIAHEVFSDNLCTTMQIYKIALMFQIHRAAMQHGHGWRARAFIMWICLIGTRMIHASTSN